MLQLRLISASTLLSYQQRVHARLCFLLLTFIGCLMNSAIAAEDDSLRKQFQGDYELVSFLRFPAEGGEIDANYIGRLSYDAFGNMSGLGMPRDLPARAANERGATGGFAYWGTVSFDAENGRVIHHVKGSPMVPAWVGQDNIRFFEFSGDLLKLSLKDDRGRVTGTLTWRKLSAP